MNEPQDVLTRIQQVIDRSVASADPAMRENFVHDAWVMSAEELLAFWAKPRLASVAKTSASGRVHAAPLEVSLVDGRLHLPTFANARRLRDHREVPGCVVTSWDDAYSAVIVHGDAAVGDRSTGMVDVVVTPTRILAICPPAGHHSRAIR